MSKDPDSIVPREARANATLDIGITLTTHMFSQESRAGVRMWMKYKILKKITFVLDLIMDLRSAGGPFQHIYTLTAKDPSARLATYAH